MRKTVLFTFVFLVLASLVWGQEVLLNGNLENWDNLTTPTNWTHVENITQESTLTLVHGGTYSAQHIGGTKDLGQTISGIIAGDDYDLTIWYKVDVEGDGSDARIWSYWKNGENNLTDNADELRGPNNSYFDNNGGIWTLYSVTVTAPATADNFYFEVRTYSGATVYWDDFSFYHVETSDPTIILSESSFSGFSYIVGNGPSAEQSFTVQGTNLTADISIIPPSNYEISTGSGGSFSETNPITLTQSSGSVTETTIYVRLKSELSEGTYDNEDIICSSAGANNKTVTCNGGVIAVESLPFSESFGSSSWPAGWTYDDFTIENSINAGGSAYETELSYSNDVPGTSNITTPPIDTNGETELILAWNQNVSFYESGTGTDFVIQVLTSTDGLTFSNVAWSQTVTADETELKQVTLDTGDGIGSGTFYVRWLYYQNNTDVFSFWYIDDISLSADSPTVIENISHSPQNPNTSQTVSLSADVTDSDGISSVELHWGTSSGSLGNTIDMSTSGRASYTTDSDIPAQSEGTTVYYEIYVLDDNANDTISDEFNYYVSDADNPSVGDLIISEICGDNADGANDDDGFVEIYNNSGNTLLLESVQVRYYNSNPGTPSTTYELSGVILADDYIVITQDNTAFTSQYGFAADFEAGGNFYFNGGDDGIDIYSTAGREGILDSFNDNGTGASPWDWSENNVYERIPDTDGTLETSWTEVTEGTGTPGAQNSEPPTGPTKLAITNVNDDFYPTVDAPFSIVVQAQDNNSDSMAVTAETQFTLSVNTGSGSLSGTVIGSITAGSYETTVTGIIYDTVETGVSLTATRTSGDDLTSGISSEFEVLEAADHLGFFLVPATGNVDEIVDQFLVQALRPDDTYDRAYTEDIIISVNTGSGNMSGTTTRPAIQGSSWFSDIQFDAADTYTLAASSGTLTGAVSSSIIITEHLDFWIVFSVSDDEIHIRYNGGTPAVSAGDYTLTGLETITFSSAVTEGSWIHLSGASSPIVGDLTLDTLTDSVNETEFVFYAGIMPIEYTNTLNPTRATMLNNYYATFQGVVSRDEEFYLVAIHDSADPYHGLVIANYNLGDNVDVDDEILVTGFRMEFSNTFTQIFDPFLISSTPSSHFPASLVPGSDINNAMEPDTNPAEQWEGQLIKVENAQVVSYDSQPRVYTCTDDGGATFFTVGDLFNQEYNGITIEVGNIYHITGILTYHMESYILNPVITEDVIYVGPGSLAAPDNVVITRDGGNVDISWDTVSGATHYNIYSDTDPYGTFGTLEASPADTTWSETIPVGTKKFYKITAE